MPEWSRADKIAFTSLTVAVFSCIAAVIVIPEVRTIFGLENKSSDNRSAKIENDSQKQFSLPTQATTPTMAPTVEPTPAQIVTPTPHDIGGEFQVDASSSQGTLFKNQYDKPITVRFLASGQWAFWPAQGFHSADGNPRYSVASEWGSGRYKLPSGPLGSLIILRENGSYQLVANKRTIKLNPDERVFLLMNDGKNVEDYKDNQGAITVEWRCSDCKP